METMTMLRMEMPDHTRENRSLTAVAEKRLLVWIARRVPAPIHSDHLTALGLAGMLAAGACLAAGGRAPWALAAAVGALAVNWLGDSLDGTLARVRDRLRPRYGYYVDHVCDVLGVSALLGGLGLSGFMTPAVAAAMLLAYLLVSAEIFLATHALGVFRMSFGRFGPTELRIALAAGLLRVMVSPHVTIAGSRFLLFDVGGVVGTALLGAALGTAIVRNTRRLYAAEPR